LKNNCVAVGYIGETTPCRNARGFLFSPKTIAVEPLNIFSGKYF